MSLDESRGFSALQVTSLLLVSLKLRDGLDLEDGNVEREREDVRFDSTLKVRDLGSAVFPVIICGVRFGVGDTGPRRRSGFGIASLMF